MTSYTDQQIIKSLKYRDNHVVSYISKKFLPMIKYMIKELNGEIEDAEDIFQEALIIIIKKIDSNEFKLTAKFSTYLYAVCKNLFEYKRKRERVAEKYILKQVSADVVADEDFSENYDQNYQYKIYKHYFAKLGASCQEILNLSWLDTPIKEIAEKIGSTQGYVRKKKHECKKRLIELILSNPDNINAD
jgi:RNA polymerase sigma factor (sigma-70 family)